MKKKIEKALVDMETGKKGVHVSLQYQEQLKITSRAERRKYLQVQFSQLAEVLIQQGAQVDFETMSVSGQTIEAALPLEHYEEIVEKLTKQDFRVDPVIDQQIVP